MDICLTQYQDALDYLFARVSGGWKLGLDTTRALLRALDDPHQRFPAFHVAGTNGKGSVVSTMDALLRAGGFRVGRYTSPHLIDFRERICVNDVPIPEQAVVEFIERWTPEVERLGATFFEATTCMAFDYFAREMVDVAVVEVGLGGRLDSTNVITPLATGISSIGLDHMQYLGETLEDIAHEKAGIFKPMVPAVIGEESDDIRALLSTLARRAGASPVVEIGGDWIVRDIAVEAGGTSFTLMADGSARALRTPLVGRHQAANTATAIAMLSCAGHAYRAAADAAEQTLAAVRIPGRFQRCGRVIFDVAHNPASIAVLCDTLERVQPEQPIVCLLTVLRDKDWKAMMEVLAPHVERFVLTAPPSVPNDRAWALDEPRDFAAANGWAATTEPDFDQALAIARQGAATTLITGSFHTVGDAMARLQVAPLPGYIA